MKRHSARDVVRCSKRHAHMNECISSSSSHHQIQPRLHKQEAFNQNRSVSPINVDQHPSRTSKHSSSSSSYTSLNSYLKDFHLSEKDFLELREALKRIFQHLQPKIRHNHRQRLTSPYLQQQLIKDDQSSLPLYTNEYFIRNGLLNHNDGPEINDNIFPSRNVNHSRPVLRFESCLPSFPSSMNIPLPLSLLSNEKYLFTALSSNFASEKPRHSQSSLELTEFQYHEKGGKNVTETESMILRRNKVQTWERGNIFQRKMSMEYPAIPVDDQTDISEYHRSSVVLTHEKTMIIPQKLIVENSFSSRTHHKEERNNQFPRLKNTNNFFPMVKKLAPYIIIRDSFHRPINTKNSTQQMSHRRMTSKKHLSTDALQSTPNAAKGQSLLLPLAPNGYRTNNEGQVLQRKKNYLLAEFESVLTSISKE